MLRAIETAGLFAITATKALSVRMDDAQTVAGVVKPDVQNGSNKPTNSTATNFEDFKEVSGLTLSL